ncbi:S-layer homoloy domain-containing protein [Romboutsia ilealis]|uniref:S-layer homoloy domain-containing protein n=1 Tax=Romboutsia ilealis TaxID=1115758 RepID=A0A1V1I3I0_9FIRM|nr:S-layer homology domain-containing protein [Romboutsia ilealis]CED94677.1 S-layer homoloy domain-containing protein [Romboutsia ilealis]
MKNKKNIAMAMAAVSTLGAVAPVFADEIIGTVVDNFNLDNLTSTDDKVRVQAEKDLEVTKAAIEKLVNEVDSNGNKIYDVTQREEIKGEIGQRYSYVYVTLTSKDDVNNTVEHKFTFYKKVKLVGDTDQDFGKELPWDTENKIIFDFIGKNNKVFVYNPETKEVNKEKDTDAYAELSRVIYQLKKSSSKITAIREVIQTGDTYADGYTIYAGKIGQDATGETKVARIDILGNVDEKLVKLVDANNDFVGHWAEDTIVDSMIAGIVDNTAKFNPEQEITRAQFAKMVCEANNIEPIKYNQDNKEKFDKFTDVSVTEWYAGYVAAIYETGLMKGDGNGTFRPEDKISRQEVAVVLATLENNGVSVEEVTTDVNGNRVHKDTKTNFVDDSEIAIWADESVEHLRNKGFAKGYAVSGGKFEYRPVNNMSRAEALTMITRVSK